MQRATEVRIGGVTRDPSIQQRVEQPKLDFSRTDEGIPTLSQGGPNEVKLRPLAREKMQQEMRSPLPPHLSPPEI